MNERLLKNKNRAPGSLTKQDLTDAYNFFDGKCPYSETKLDPNNWHLEHIIPVIMGGTTDPWNCIPVCGPCNLSKGGKHLLDWWDETHTNEEEYKLEKIFIYILNSLNKPRNYQISTIQDAEIISKLEEEKMIEKQQEYEDENYINITKKLDTFTFLYQIKNHLNYNKKYIRGNIEEYKEKLDKLYTQNKEYERKDAEVFKLQNELTNYLKELGVIKHYSIVYEYLDKLGNVEEIKNKVEEIKTYIGQENISDLINKNPSLLSKDLPIEKIQSRLEYLFNI